MFIINNFLLEKSCDMIIYNIHTEKKKNTM